MRLVAVALPFARRAMGQHSHVVAAVSVLTVVVLILIAVFDLRSTSDAIHARIPYIYLAYIVVGDRVVHALRRKRVEICGRLDVTAASRFPG